MTQTTQSRSEKHKEQKDKKFKQSQWLKVGALTLIVVGAFIYLMQRLEPAAPRGTPSAAQTASADLKTGAPGADKLREAAPAGAAATDAAKSETATPAGASPVGSPAEPKINLAFVGDIMFADKVEEILKKNGYDYPFKYVKPYLEKADYAIANLETPISERGDEQSKEYAYRSSPLALPELKKSGLDLVNVANNHSMDYGVQGFLDTLDALDAQGIRRVGGGRNQEEAYRHATVDIGGVKVAFLGFSRVVPDASWYAGKSKPGLAETYSAKLPLEAIGRAREEADLVVVIAHWGEERRDRPVTSQTDLAHQYIDQGADLVVASHPHVLQGFEQYKGKWIAYSLGNFIFSTNENPSTWESMILQASCSKQRACDLSVVPVLTKWAQPIRMVDEDGDKLFKRLSQISVNAQIDAHGKVSPGPLNPLLRLPQQVIAPAAGIKSGKDGASGKPKETEAAKPGAGAGTKDTGKTTDKDKTKETTKTPDKKSGGSGTKAGDAAGKDASGGSGASRAEDKEKKPASRQTDREKGGAKDTSGSAKSGSGASGSGE